MGHTEYPCASGVRAPSTVPSDLILKVYLLTPSQNRARPAAEPEGGTSTNRNATGFSSLAGSSHTAAERSDERILARGNGFFSPVPVAGFSTRTNVSPDCRAAR